MDTTEKLNRLSDLQAQADVIRLRYQELRDGIMTPEIKAALAEVDAEEATTIEAVSAGIASLTDEIKQEVVASGASVKGSFLQAVWTKGRTSMKADDVEKNALIVQAVVLRLAKPVIDLMRLLSSNADATDLLLVVHSSLSEIESRVEDILKCKKEGEPSVSIRAVK